MIELSVGGKVIDTFNEVIIADSQVTTKDFLSNSGYFLISNEILESDFGQKAMEVIKPIFKETLRTQLVNRIVRIEGTSQLFESCLENESKQYDIIFKKEGDFDFYLEGFKLVKAV